MSTNTKPAATIPRITPVPMLESFKLSSDPVVLLSTYLADRNPSTGPPCRAQSTTKARLHTRCQDTAPQR
ncbi:hypothetical protein PC122_g25568, partial [Phytophthora cactorum]